MCKESCANHGHAESPVRRETAPSSFFAAVQSRDFEGALKSWGTSGEGVDLAEVDAKGESSLHLLARSKKYDDTCAALFAKVLAAASEILSHCNDAGQSFLHCAAGRLNCRILAQAVSECPQLAPLFVPWSSWVIGQNVICSRGDEWEE
ncbi:unnamed protein product [Cladocopium goreaui]|uniref:Uncharacterized protein n=1 Tax=Cladocopium goreaui TaxID=2562237 RepID=A0A9P1GEW7_9DINO|nr:unnamed protein product [Cladocopium goreaui]